MKKVILSLAILLSFAQSYGQNSSKDNLESEVKKLQELNLHQNGIIAKQASELKSLTKSVEFLNKELEDIKIKQTNDSAMTNSRIDAIF